MEIISKYEVKITEAEIKELIKKAHGIGYDFELTVIKESEAASCDNEGWIDVPNDWNKSRCPTDYPNGNMLEVMFRDGSVGKVEGCDSSILWIQDSVETDIVKYHPVN